MGEQKLKNQIMEFRVSLNLSQYELSQKVGVSRTNISKIETRKSIPSVVLAHKIVDVLGVCIYQVSDATKKVIINATVTNIKLNNWEKVIPMEIKSVETIGAVLYV